MFKEYHQVGLIYSKNEEEEEIKFNLFSDFSLPGQCIDVTNLPNGNYFLLNRANPLKLFYEINTENNDAWVQFELSGNSIATRNLRILSTANCDPIGNFNIIDHFNT